MIRRQHTKVPMSIILALLLMAMWAPCVFADSMPPYISTNMYNDRYEPGVIKAQVLDDTRVSKVTLFYRKPGDIDYNSIDMKSNSDIYYRELKRELGVRGTVEYYLLAQDTSGNEKTEPALDAQENPLVTSMDDVVNQSADEVVLSSPEPGTLLVTGNQMIIVSFYKTDREVDMGTVRIRIDDRDRTREADIVGNLVMWEPRRPLADGIHVVEIYAKSTAGQIVGPNIWSFRVKTKLELPMGMTGNFYAGFQHDERSDNSTNVPLWNNKIDVSLAGEKDWLSWEAGVMLSSEESAFLTSEDLPARQPINRYYLDARTRHWKLHLGDSNPNFSELSLKGVLVRGLDAQFKSNRFNAELVYGYNKRDIGENVALVQNVSNVMINGYTDESTGEFVDISTRPTQEIIQDSNGEYHVYEFNPGTFKRDVMALKLNTLPVRSRWLRWDIGLNLFSAQDDSTSLSTVYDPETKGRLYDYGNNVLFPTGYAPKKNWVGTIETSFRFNNNRSILSAEFGGTIVTDNLYGVVTDDIRDEIPDTIDDSVFRINGSTQTSFDKMKLKDSIGAGLGDAIFSVYKFRFITPLPIKATRTSLRAELYRIPTHYVSLGNPHEKTDVGGYKLNLKTQFLQDQVGVSLDYNAYSDNLNNETKQYSNTEQSAQKDLTKDTNVASVTVNLMPKILPDYAPAFSVGYRTYTSENNLDYKFNEKMNKVKMATNTAMFSVAGTLPVGLQQHRGTLSFTNMDISDDRPVADYERSDSKNLTVLFNVNSTINPLPLAINFAIGRTGNTTYFPVQKVDQSYYRKQVDTGINMVNLSGSYKWFRDKRLKTTIGFGYIGSSNGEGGTTYEVDNTKTSARIEADYKFSRMASFGGMIKFVSFTDNVNSGADYTEPIIGIDLRSNF
ncbi:hypothetical protein LLG96_17890 [bacterium]|nr:hypothetical protein [bacterium]